MKGTIRKILKYIVKEGKRAKLTENCVDLITMEELETTIKTLKARKSPGSDGINNEFTNMHQKVFYINF